MLNSEKKSLSKGIFLRVALLVILIAGAGLFIYAESNAKDIHSRLTGVGQSSFVPHKALYNINLHSVKSAAKVINVEGKMLYSMQQTCEGYLGNHHFNLLYEYADTPGLHVTSDFTSFENFSGNKLEFFSSRNRESDLIEEYNGEATLNSHGDGVASYYKPLDKEYKLPLGTLFPNQHTLEVLKAAKEGKKFYTATVFDGSDETGPLIVNAFILNSGEPLIALNASVAEDSGDIESPLFENKSWRVRLAFFPLEAGLSEPDYEMTVRLHENGVISDMFVEYTDFSVTQKLVAIEENGKPECKKNVR